MSLLTVRGGACLRNVRGVGMMVLKRQTAVDGTVQVISAAEGRVLRTHKSRRREGHVMRVAGRRRRAVAQEQSAPVAASPVAVVRGSRR